MRVLALELEARRADMFRPVETAEQRWASREWLWLTLRADSGMFGVGEAAPLPGRSPETLARVQRELSALQKELLPFELDLCLPVAAQVRRLVQRAGLSCASGQFAFESALFDLAGRAVGAPASTLLAGRPATTPVSVNALLPSGPPEVVLAEAQSMLQRGFTTFKVKIGRRGRWDDERDLLCALRQTLPSRIRLRADANGAWPLLEARTRLAELASLDLEFVEQPVAPGELLRFGQAATPLAADETLTLPGAFDQLIAGRACHAVVLKPMLLGGALRCLEMARQASAAGVAVVVTGLLDGAVAAAAASELALALDHPPLACGLSPAVGPGADPLAAQPLYAPHDRPGLGLTPPGQPP